MHYTPLTPAFPLTPCTTLPSPAFPLTPLPSLKSSSQHLTWRDQSLAPVAPIAYKCLNYSSIYQADIPPEGGS